jgi:hypothetical protein
MPFQSRAAFDLRIYGGGAAFGGFDIEGTAVADLVDDTTYPNAPNAVETVTAVVGEGGIALIELTTGKFEFQQAFNGFSIGDSGLNNYGGAASALLYPPATGNYTFYVRSDDSSQLFLSTDETRGNLALIAEETGCCNPLTANASEPVALEAGQAYYIEILWKEGGGGDGFQVGWSFEGGPAGVIPGGYIQRDISSYALGINGVPASEGLIITPGDFTSFNALEPIIPERGSHDLVAEFDFDGVATIQWQVDTGSGFEDIEGAISPVLTVEGDVNNDGNRYRVIINGETSPTEYSVTVEPDTEIPVVESATHGGNPNGLLITFSEAVTEETATDLDNFTLDGSALPGDTVATLSEDGLTLTLLGSFEFKVGDSKTLEISGITDFAASPNSIETTEFTIDYSSGGSIINSEGLLSYWNFEGSYNDAAKGLPGNASTVDDNGIAGSGVSFESGGPAGTYGLFNGQGDTSLVEIPNSDDILADGEDFSITAWFRVDTFDKSWQAIVAHGESNDWRIHRNGGNNEQLAFKGGSAEPTGGSPVSPINDGEWHHVVGTVVDGVEARLYIDGELINTIATSSIASNGAPRMMIGGNPDTAGDAFRTWNGGIDEVTLWNRALSEDEVATLASSGSLAGGSLGPISIKTQPLAAADVPEHQEVELKVETDGSSTGLGFQWYFTPEGGTEATMLEGATSGTLKFIAGPSRAGSYYAVARNWFSDATTETVSVSVVPDTTPPGISSLSGSPLNNSVTITYNEPVTAESAGNPDNYSIEGLDVTGVTVVSSTVVNVATDAQDEGTKYTLSISGIQDAAETPNTLETSQSFNSYKLGKGGLTALFYEDGGGEFSDFFPDNRGRGMYPEGFAPFGTGVNLDDISARLSTVTTYFESPATGDINTPPAANIIDNYAQVIYGWIVPPESGNYRFGLATDDNSELYLSSDESPDNSILIANETGWSGVRNYQTVGGTSDANAKQSEAIALEAGQQYYVELIVAEGGGGDNAAVAWTFSADGDPAPVVDGALPIPAEYLWSFLPVNDEIQLVSASPADGDTGVYFDNTSISFGLRDGLGNVIDPESVVLSINGQPVDAEVTKDGDETTVSYAGSDQNYSMGSTVNVSVTWSNTDGGDGSRSWSFEVESIPDLQYAAPLSGAGDEGMLVTVRQGLDDAGATRPNDTESAEAQLAGEWGNIDFERDDVVVDYINHNQDAGGAAGRFADDISMIEADLMSADSTDSITWQVITYIEFPEAGPVTMTVNSDDGFRVTHGEDPAISDDDIELGVFSGGRGAADTTFRFIVPEPGIYPFRLLWYEGGGGANVEWWTQDSAGVRHLINDPSDEAAFNAFTSASPISMVGGGGGDAEITAFTSEGGNISITYTGTLQSAPAVTGPWTNVDGASSPHSEAIGDGAKFFRVVP